MRDAKPGTFTTREVEGEPLIHSEGKIYIPEKLQQRVVAWYHEYLAHPGETRTEATIRQHFTWPRLRKHVHNFCRTFKQCQLCKKQRKKQGHLLPKEAESLQWERVHVDLIGKYMIKSDSGTQTLQCLIMIDPATGWFKIKALKDKTADTVIPLCMVMPVSMTKVHRIQQRLRVQGNL